MKKYLIFFFAMLMAASSLVLTSCSSDDDENGDGTNYSEMIVGSWKWKFSIDGDEWYGESYTHFYPNGTYKEVNITVYYGSTERDTDSGSWSISGNKLIMDGVEDISTISKLTDSEMVISVAGAEFTKLTKVEDSVFEKYYNQK